MNKNVRTTYKLAVGFILLACVSAATATGPDSKVLVKPAPAPMGSGDDRISNGATTVAPGSGDDRRATAAPDGASAPTPAPVTPGGPDDRKPAAPKA